MPPYITQPSANVWPPVTIPCVSPSYPCYSFGSYTPYADAPNLQVEHSETLPSSATAGEQFAVRAFAGLNQNSPAITWETTITGTPATVDIRLQGALIDSDAQYFDLDKSTNAAGEARTVSLGASRVNFLRIKVAASSGGTSPTLIAKFIL